MTAIIVRATGAYVPEQIVTNHDLAARMDTSDEWIVTRTGIHARHLANTQETPAFMGTQAAQRALAKAGLKATDIDLLIVATMTPDHLCPPTACLIQHALGMRPIPAFDVEIACSGFVYILEIATRMLQSGPYKHALIIGAEKMSHLMDWEDRSTCVLFGDGAGCAILSKDAHAQGGISDTILGADGSYAPILDVPAGGSAKPCSPETLANRQNFLKMNGKEVFKFAVRMGEQVILEMLHKHHLTPNDIDWIIPHQANIRIVQALAEKLSMPIEKFICNLQRLGNTSAASIPLALDEALERGSIQSGQTVLLLAFGAGASWGCSLIHWH